MDIISECEKLGDYVVNVVEARTDIKEKKIQFSLFKKQKCKKVNQNLYQKATINIGTVQKRKDIQEQQYLQRENQ